MRNPVWKLPAIVVACLAIAGVAACKKEAASSVTAHLPEVKVVTVAAHTVADEPEFLGETEDLSRDGNSVTGNGPSQGTVLYREARRQARGQALSKGGLANYLDVLIAQRNLFEAELSFTATHRLHLASIVQLYKALGGGWAQESDGKRGLARGEST